MKTISIVNLKGGVGKTITAVNLAAILATEYGQRVLLIDADHQGNASKFYSIPAEPGSLADLLECTITCYDEITQPTIYRGLDVIPADMSLAALDVESSMPDIHDHDRLPRERALHAMIDLRDAVAEDAAYDYIVIDCPPALSIASIAAIAASDEIVIPVKPGRFEIDGMAELQAQVDSIRKVNSRARIAGVLLTMWHNSDVVRQGEEWLRQNANVFRQTIRRTDKVDESTFAREPICQWSPTSAAAKDYRAWVREYLGGEIDG